MLSELKKLYQYRQLVFYLTWGRIKSGERDKTFGKLWSLLNPLALLAIYYFIFNVIFESRIEYFSLFLFSAIIAWRFFSTSVSTAAVCMPTNHGLIQEAYFPRTALPVSVVLISAYDYVFGLVVLLGMSWYLGVTPSVYLLFWPLVFFVEFVLTVGASIWAALLGAYFRDLQNILSIVFRLFFYLSGTMYDVSRIPESFQPYFRLNPIYILYESYRNILLYGKSPDLLYLTLVFVGALLLTGSGLRMLRSKEGQLIKYL